MSLFDTSHYIMSLCVGTSHRQYVLVPVTLSLLACDSHCHCMFTYHYDLCIGWPLIYVHFSYRLSSSAPLMELCRFCTYVSQDGQLYVCTYININVVQHCTYICSNVGSVMFHLPQWLSTAVYHCPTCLLHFSPPLVVGPSRGWQMCA